jgi:aminoglycoside phosphotransferase (APT) family kinase protein
VGRAIPVEAADLDPNWLTEVLRVHAPDVEVVAAHVVDAHSGTTGRVRLRLEYAGARGDLPDTVFCKIAPFEPRQRAFLHQIGIGAMEARFYAQIAPIIDGVRFPRVWHAEADEHGGFVIVLEDLEATGCRFPRPSDPDIEDRAASTVEELARLHAPFWMSPRLDDTLAWVPTRAGFGSSGRRDDKMAKAAAQFVTAALAQFADAQGPAFRAVGTLYADRTADILDLFDEGERTLIHGDPHAGNLFTDGGRTGFFDWAMFSRSPGMRDVAYYCCNSLPTEVRRRILGPLVDRYRSRLSGDGVELPAPVAERELRLFAVYSWVSATSTAAVGSRWQPSARAVAAMERTTAAVDDLDSVGLLRELLG